ncbi:MAG: sugar phosphate isomerase/epimerase family protein [Beutenbergiaceae bacterium]
MSDRNVRLGATMITFYNTGYWGLPDDVSYEDFRTLVNADPRPYFERMLDGMVAAGVEGIELAPIPGGWQNALKAYGDAAGFAQALTSRGLELGSSYQNGESLIGEVLDGSMTEAQVDTYVHAHAQFVAEMGAEVIIMGTVQRSLFTGRDLARPVPDDAMERVAAQINRQAQIAARYGVRIALHTDAYSVCSRNQDITRMLELTDPASVQLCLDAGHTTLDGGDAVAALAAHVDRVPVMHWKDCSQPLDGTTLLDHPDQHSVMLEYFRIFGDGVIDWRAWQQVLADARWRGWAMAENDMAADPVAEIRKGLEFYRNELEQIYR